MKKSKKVQQQVPQQQNAQIVFTNPSNQGPQVVVGGAPQNNMIIQVKPDGTLQIHNQNPYPQFFNNEAPATGYAVQEIPPQTSERVDESDTNLQQNLKQAEHF